MCTVVDQFLGKQSDLISVDAELASAGGAVEFSPLEVIGRHYK